jgi:hypothetical protein
MERTIRAIKMQYRRISGRKNWNNYLLRYGRCVASSRMVAAATWWRGSTASSFTAGDSYIVATGPAADAPMPHGAIQPLSFSPPSTRLSCCFRNAVGANHRYECIAPIVYIALSGSIEQLTVALFYTTLVSRKSREGTNLLFNLRSSVLHICCGYSNKVFCHMR